jgi:multiple sugar transport system substrate-binding protein
MKTKTTLMVILVVALSTLSTFSIPLMAEEITFWTTEVEADRLKVQKEIALRFLKNKGVEVRVVPVEENLLTEKVTAAFAAKSLPDVIYHPIDSTMGWAEAGILDEEAATKVVKTLKEDSFARGPLKLVRFHGGYAAVPTDGWGQLLLYRKDLFQEKSLPPPDQWAHILTAAKALHNPPLLWGFEVATDPGQSYTQQVFEHFALSNGVRLIDRDGKLLLNSPEMIETLDFYKSLAAFSPPGNLYWLHTRMDYLSGRAAMIVWSPFILDELSGLRQDQPVLPDLAKGTPGLLARNTGFVTIIKGPHGAAAQYGQVNYLGITCDANRPAAEAWVKYLLDEGYLSWLSMAAEGKLPLRKGTEKKPNGFISGWMDLEFGVTTKAKISQFYGDEVVQSILAGVEGFDRWGFAQGKGPLVSKIYGTKIIPEILKRFLDDEISSSEAARLMEEKIKAFKP